MNLVITLALSLASLVQQAAPPKPIIDNERVTVWDTTSTDVSGLQRPTEDSLAIYLTPTPRVVFRAKGEAAAPAPPGDPAGVRLITFHDRAVTPIRNASGFPNAFPRPGATKLVDNARVIVWDYTFTPGAPSPMHFHNTDVVVVYLSGGTLRSTTPEGQVTNNEYASGATRFNKGNRTHTELLEKGNIRIIATELK